MKKLLALVLALVMTMGLATVGTSAAFADAASIEHSEAVEVLNALGVVGGKENNNFDPTANVKRSEMAKMVTIAMLGDVDVSAFAGAPTDLTDINGHWAEGYIKYCYSQGIIGGRGNGKFDPDANVTATEAAKMLLVAIGYSADVQGYGGDQWKVNVARDAQLSGFYADLSGLTVDKVLTRDETAQLVYNAMDADLIVKKPTLNVNTGTIQYTYEKNTNKEDLLRNIFKASTFEGTLDKFSYDSTKAKWTLSVSPKGGTQNVTWQTTAVTTRQDFGTTTDYTGLFKQNVKVLYTLDSKGNLDKAIGVYPSDSEVLVSHVIGKIDAPNAGATKLRVDGKDYSLTSNVSNVAVYNFQHAYLDAYVTSADTIATAAFMTVATPASEKVSYLFNLIDNTGDGKGDVIVVFPKTVAKVSSLSSGYVTLTDGLQDSAIGATTTVKLSDIDAYDGIAKNDYVFVTPKANTATNKMKVEKAELQTGTVSATKTDEEQIGGAWLKSVLLSGNATAGDEVEYIALNGFLAYQAGTSKTGAEKFVAVLDKETAASGYTDSATLTTKLLFSDGTKKDVKVSYVNDVKMANGNERNVYLKGLYAYTMDGDNYKLYDVTTAYVGNTSGKKVNVSYDVLAANSLGTGGSTTASTYTYVYRDGSAYVASVDTTASTARIKMTSDSSIYAIADDAVIFVYNSTADSMTVTTGAQLKKSSDANTKVVFLAADKNSSTGFNEVKLAYVYNGTGVTGKSNYAFAMDDVETVKSGSNYYKQVSVWDGTALTTLKTESKSSAPGYLDAVSKGKAFSYKLNASGVITENVSVGNIGTVGAVAVTAYDEGSTIEASDTVVYKGTGSVLTYTGSSTVYTYTVDDDTEIFYVNMADGVGVASGSVSVAVEDKFGSAVNGDALTKVANAVIVRRMNSGSLTEKVDLIVIDIGGDILGVRSK